MAKFFVYPYQQNSKSAIAITEELGGKRILRVGSNYKYNKDEHVLINWGCGECPYKEALNAKIMAVVNKLKFYDRLSGTGLTPAYATTQFEAKSLGYPVFCRTSVEGKDGEGIVVADCDGQLAAAPLYVKGIDKTAEYRVHVGRNYDGGLDIIGASPKSLKPIEATMQNVPADKRVWSGDVVYFGDFMEGAALPTVVADVALKAMDKFSELTFIALDIVYDGNADKAYVIEGNSAPMMTQKTREAYGQFFKEYAKQKELANLPKPVVTTPPVPVAAPEAAAPVRTKEEIAADIANNIVELISLSVPVMG